MIIGEHTRGNDLEVNPLRAKKLTNIRAAGKDDNLLLTPPIRMTLEQAIAYIADDELVEVTPKAIRLRKRHLDPTSASGRRGRRKSPDAPAAGSGNYGARATLWLALSTPSALAAVQRA